MEEHNNKTCGCGSCGCMGMGHWGGGHMLVRVVIGLLMLLAAFWVGVKVGELQSELYGYFGNCYGGYCRAYPMMMCDGYGGGAYGSWNGYGMMGGALPPTAIPGAAGAAGAATSTTVK